MEPSNPLVEETVAMLGRESALESIAADPYWPKWDGPWWRMTVLWELGLAALIPKSAVAAMVSSLRSHYLPFFPLPGELPSGKDPHRHVICHCAVGTMHQLLSACGVAVETELPWLTPWLLKHQLPDGGLNCDEKACAKAVPKSSMVSTLPALEAILGKKELAQPEIDFLDRGARYLIAHRLFRSTKGALIDARWTQLCFPRFYDYDILRGLDFLRRWSARLGRPLPRESVAETEALLAAKLSGKTLRVERRGCDGARTLRRDESGAWIKSPTSASFPLLDEVSRIERESPELTRLLGF